MISHRSTEHPQHCSHLAVPFVTASRTPPVDGHAADVARELSHRHLSH